MLLTGETGAPGLPAWIFPVGKNVSGNANFQRKVRDFR